MTLPEALPIVALDAAYKASDVYRRVFGVGETSNVVIVNVTQVQPTRPRMYLGQIALFVGAGLITTAILGLLEAALQSEER